MNIHDHLGHPPIQHTPQADNVKENNPPLAKKTKSVGGEIIESKPQEIKEKTISKKVTVPLDSVKKVPYISAEALMDQLKPGDIILSYYPKVEVPVDAPIRAGQFAAKIYTKSTTDVSHNFVHAALYVGEGKISEALAEGMQISELDGERFRMETDAKHSFLIVRPKDEAMAREAALISEELSTEVGTETKLKYSVPKAFFSTLRSSEMDTDSVKRYLKGAAYAHAKIFPTDKNGIRNFFCSYFVGWACQAGESKRVIAEINKELPPDKQITFPDLSHVPEKRRGEVLEKWAKDIAVEHLNLFKKHITLDFDPKYTTPQRFYGFVLEHPELFTQEMMIVAPPKEMEMTDFSPNPVAE